MSTLETLQDILVKEFDFNRAQLIPEAEITGLGIDSLDMLDFLFKIEDRFALKITDDIPTTLVTLNDVVQYVNGLIAKRLDSPKTGNVHLDKIK